MVGLLPVCAVTVYEAQIRKSHPEVFRRGRRFIEARPELTAFIHDPERPGHADQRLVAILNETKLRRVLEKMLDEREFLSPFGIRSLSRYHADHPYVIHVGGQEYRAWITCRPSRTAACSAATSNWRGPIWFPVNALLIRALLQYYLYYGDELTVECPTGSGRRMNLFQVAQEIESQAFEDLSQGCEPGRRPVFGGTPRFQEDPHWRDCLLFYEYFHGDNGAGLGASHQTGWTGRPLSRRSSSKGAGEPFLRKWFRRKPTRPGTRLAAANGEMRPVARENWKASVFALTKHTTWVRTGYDLR